MGPTVNHTTLKTDHDDKFCILKMRGLNFEDIASIRLGSTFKPIQENRLTINDLNLVGSFVIDHLIYE